MNKKLTTPTQDQVIGVTIVAVIAICAAYAVLFATKSTIAQIEVTTQFSTVINAH